MLLAAKSGGKIAECNKNKLMKSHNGSQIFTKCTEQKEFAMLSYCDPRDYNSALPGADFHP